MRNVNSSKLILIFNKMIYWLCLALFIIVIVFLLFFYEQYCHSTEKGDAPVAEEVECEGEDCVVIDDPLPEPQPSPHPAIQGNLICYLTEYDQPPDDTQGSPSQDEIEQINNTLDDDDKEEFRIRRGGGGGRRGGGGGRGGPRGGGMFWPWRTWPRRHWGRPWRSYWWRSYPDYIYTYPYSYYYSDWVAPIQRFTVRIGPKGDRHPFVDQGSDLGYMITTGTATGCGTSGAQLNLQRGRTYEFDIYTSVDCVTGQPRNEPFFFTTDKEGGSQGGEIFNITPTRNGTIRITITENLPSQFYYQSTNSSFVGGYVFLHS